MTSLVKYRFEILLVFLLAILYFLLRLPHLTLQPIFADEAIYIRWAQIMKSEPTLRFVSLSDGKTPLFMWAMIPVFKFIHDPLMAGRLLSVFSGFLTLLGIFFLTRYIFGKTTAFWAAFLYSITPYTVFFDRMALVDSMLAAFSLWGIYLAILLARTLRFDTAMVLGYLLGGGLLVKTPAMTNIMMLPASILAFKINLTKHYSLYRLFLNWIISITIAMLIYNILRLGPGFEQLSARNADYMFSPLELLGRPLDPFIPHLHDITDWFPKMFTWPILLLTFIGTGFILAKRNRYGMILLLWSLVPMILFMAFLKTFTARYLLSSIPPLLIVAAFGLTEILASFKKRVVYSLVAFLFLLPLPVYFDWLLLTNPQMAPLPNEERIGYFEDWTAGYGFAQIADFLINQSSNRPVVVGTEGFFGTLPDGLQIYLDKSKIAVIGSSATISAQLKNSAKNNLTYFVANKNRLAGSLPDAKLIMEFPKAKPRNGRSQDAIVVYQVF